MPNILNDIQNSGKMKKLDTNPRCNFNFVSEISGL